MQHQLTQKGSLQWSPRLRNNSISISGQSIERKVHAKLGLASCLTNNIDNQVQSQSIKIKSGGWIAVGICQTRKALLHEFQLWDWKEIGHGHYCIFSDEFVVSHHQSEINYKRKAFPIRSGNVLHFKFDKAKGKLRIEEDDGRNLEINVEQSQGEQYAACVHLWDVGASVDLINQ